MIIHKAVEWGIEQLEKANVDSYALDAELLLVHVFNKGREFLFAHPEKTLTIHQVKKYKSYIKRRVKREPVAYILGYKEFFGLDFIVDKNVLIPRPETEVLVEQALKDIKGCTVVDVGTGSGAIVVALAKNQPEADFVAIDVSQKALSIAKRNAKRHKVKVKFIKSDLLDFKIKNSKVVIVANLPYGYSGEYKNLQPEITKYEPRVAIDGGRDGLKYYRGLLKQIKSFKNFILFCEIDPRQVRDFKKLVKKYFPKGKMRVIKDLAGKDRIVKIILN